MLKVGLTGGIGSGKSTVSKYFEELGVPVIDADVIAQQIVQPGKPALDCIADTFGEQFINPDGSLDRARLREEVFSDPEQKKRLEDLLHPLIYQRIKEETGRLQAHYCIISIPLLIETGMMELVDRILVVDCPAEAQIERVKKRSGLDSVQIERIMASQVSRETRLKYADDIIDNSKQAVQLAEQVKKLHNLYLQRS